MLPNPVVLIRTRYPVGTTVPVASVQCTRMLQPEKFVGKFVGSGSVCTPAWVRVTTTGVSPLTVTVILATREAFVVFSAYSTDRV